MRVEFQVATQFQRDNYDISGTDVALMVAVDGEYIGYTDDYGTFSPMRREWESQEAKEAVEEAVKAVGNLYVVKVDAS